MATVRASCPACGDVEMTIRDVQVQVGFETHPNSYSFLCPSCEVLVNKSATDRIMEILVGAGVRVVSLSRPAELDEARFGPPITHDELLAFHFDLDESGWLEAQVSGLGSSAPRRRTPERS